MDTGLHHVPGFLTLAEQSALIEIARTICQEAPLLRPCMRIAGRTLPFKLTLTNCGPWGWWSDERGFRYVDKHPKTGRPFPPIPDLLLELAEKALARCGLPPMRVDNCLINHYAEGESLGPHRDRTEDDMEAPIISLSVGAEALFQMGGPNRNDPTTDHTLRSGDLLIQSGPSRGYFHGIKRICPTMDNPLRDGSRLNFTLRKVKLP